VRRAVLSPIAVVLGASLVLAGCADGGDADPTATPSPTATPGDAATPDEAATLSPDVPVDQLPTPSGEFGEKPEFEFPSSTHLGEGAVHVLSEGDGEVVETGDLLLADYLGQIWDGEVFDNSYDRGAPAAFPIGVGQVVSGWDAGLVGQKVGSRVLLSLPPSLGYGAGGNPAAGIGGTDTIVFVVDIVNSFAGDSAGDPDATPSEPLPADGPQVTGELGAPAVLEIPEGTAEPTEQELVYLSTGSGAPIADGDRIVAQYTVGFYDGSASASTWENGAPEFVEIVTGPPVEELIGVPEGSRVMITVPAAEGQLAYAIVLDVVAIP